MCHGHHHPRHEHFYPHHRPPYGCCHAWLPVWMMTVEEEVKMLEDVKEKLEYHLKRVEERLKVLKKE